MPKFQAEKAAIVKMQEIKQALDYAIDLAEAGAESGDIAVELGDVGALVDQWLSSVKQLARD